MSCYNVKLLKHFRMVALPPLLCSMLIVHLLLVAELVNHVWIGIRNLKAPTLISNTRRKSGISVLLLGSRIFIKWGGLEHAANYACCLPKTWVTCIGRCLLNVSSRWEIHQRSKWAELYRIVWIRQGALLIRCRILGRSVVWNWLCY